MTYQTVVTDLSDVKRIHDQMDLYLKPIAKIYITVSLPKLKIAGQTISNWELQKKLKELCAPAILKTFTVSKSTMEYIRFESEVSNRAAVKSYVAALDNKSIKLAGFPEILKVSCSEAKSNFPTRQDWDEYFGDSNLFDETQPGERPDTIYLSGVPCQFFSDSKTGIVSTDKVEKLFSVYGKVRNIDIPMLDPYRSDVKGSSTKNFKPFSHLDEQLSFEMFVQFEDYPSFEDCMSSFRYMKLLLLENSDKAVAVSIKVDFDRSKHLSDQSIRHRLMEKEKIEKLQRQREEEKRKEKEKAEEKVRRKKEEARREQEMRRQRREERRKRKKQEKDMQIAAAKAAYRIAMEERKLKFASRRLEAIRLVTYLCQRVQRDMEAEEIERKRRHAREMRALEERKRKEMEEKKQQRFYKEHELKSRILKRKLEEEYKYGRRNNQPQRSTTSSSNRR